MSARQYLRTPGPVRETVRRVERDPRTVVSTRGEHRDWLDTIGAAVVVGGTLVALYALAGLGVFG